MYILRKINKNNVVYMKLILIKFTMIVLMHIIIIDRTHIHIVVHDTIIFVKVIITIVVCGIEFLLFIKSVF